MILGNPFFVIFSALLPSSVLFANLYQLMGNKIFIPFMRAETIAYLILLLAIVMLKSRGVQAVNLNIFDIYTQAIEYPASVAVNVFLFVPVGMLLFRYIKSVPKAFALALAIIVVIEALQYCLHLGIADIVDVVVNMIGLSIGYLSLDVLRGKGVCVIPDGRNYARIGFSQESTLDGNQPRASKEKPPKKKSIVAVLVACSLIVLLFVGSCFYEYEEYEP